MADLVDTLANSLPDLAILVISAIAFSVLGGGIALASNRLWFRRWAEHSPYEEKLGDTAHVSLLGFAAFVLALLITNGVSNLSKTEENIRKEALSVYRLGRELGALGPSAHDARLTLGAYARNVADDEGPRLAALPNTLSRGRDSQHSENLLDHSSLLRRRGIILKWRSHVELGP
jgi:hypothetical protein